MRAQFMQSANAGRTLIELLTVLFILALLAGLLLPAVQLSRESARRMQCQANLHQWGVAIHHYETQHGAFPPGYRLASPISSFVPLVLPYVEGQNTSYDPSVSWGHPHNQEAMKTRVAILNCPSTASRNRFDASRGFPAAVGDYTCVQGVSASYCALAGWPAFHPPHQNGVLTHEPCPAASVTDGLSQTVLLVEVSGRPFLWRMGGGAVGIAQHGAWANPKYGISVSGSDRLPYGSGEAGGTCVMNCTNDGEVYSFHSGGAQFLFADGSVHFVSQQVGERTFAAMITRSSNDKMNASGL